MTKAKNHLEDIIFSVFFAWSLHCHVNENTQYTSCQVLTIITTSTFVNIYKIYYGRNRT